MFYISYLEHRMAWNKNIKILLRALIGHVPFKLSHSELISWGPWMSVYACNGIYCQDDAWAPDRKQHLISDDNSRVVTERQKEHVQREQAACAAETGIHGEYLWRAAPRDRSVGNMLPTGVSICNHVFYSLCLCLHSFYSCVFCFQVLREYSF